MEGARLGPYQLITELGSGGMGKVYRAEVAGAVRGLEAGRTVALKVIHAHLLENPGFFKRFLREADIGRTIEHENVVRTYDCDALLHDGTQQNFLVMEYVEGQTLRELLDELERVPEELCHHIGREVAKGLAAIHEAGVVHRDLKPENVLITPDHVVKIMDLGVARLQDEAIRISQTGQFLGSILYAAPEAIRGRELDGRADLFGLGLVLYELATGQHPFQHADFRAVLDRLLNAEPRRAGEVNPQLSPFFEEIVHALLAKDPDERLASARELLRVLEAGETGSWWEDRARSIRRSTRRPLRRIRVPRETAIHGRADDLAWMRRAYEEAAAGRGSVLLVEGEAGIGKTRLVDEFVRSLEREGEDLNFLFGPYAPGGAATAAGAWTTAYGDHFGDEGAGPYLPQTPALVPAFDALLAGAPPPEGHPTLTRESRQTVFVHATRSLAAERPTVISIEDLHFAPEEGRALFAALALAVVGYRVLLIGTARPGLPEQWVADVQRLEHAEARRLARLGPKDLSLLLEEAFGSKPLAQQLGHQIAQKSDGNPFFTFEIIRGLREGQFITKRPDGSWVTTGAIGDIQVPSSVLDLVSARVADLCEEDRELLDIASCLGYEFDPTLVGDVVGLTRIQALKRFGQVERRHRLVRSIGRWYAFDHHQVQEALQAALNEQLQEAYHAQIAETMEAQTGVAEGDAEAVDGAVCAALSHHFLRGGRGERALRYLDPALTHLERAYHNERVIALCRAALGVSGLLEGAERARGLLRIAARHELLGRRDEQQAACEEALALAEEADDRELEMEAVEHLGMVFHSQNRFDEAEPLHERQLAMAREIGDRRGEAHATMCLGSMLDARGEVEAAQTHAEDALAGFEAAGDQEGVIRALGTLTAIRLRKGDFDAVRELTGRQLELSRAEEDRYGEAWALGNLAAVAWYQGRHEEAQVMLEHQLALHREIGDRPNEGKDLGNLAIVLASHGRHEEARQNHEAALVLARETGDRISEANELLTLSGIHVHRGLLDEARTYMEAAHALAQEIEERRLEGFTLFGMACLAEEEGRYEEGIRFCEEALVMRREAGDGPGVPETLAQHGALLIRAGRPEEARARLQEALEESQCLGIPEAILHAASRLALVSESDVDKARSLLAEHEDSVGKTCAMEAHFHLWQATDEPEHLAKAKQFLDGLLVGIPADHRTSMKENVLLNREILEAWEMHGEAAVGQRDAE